MKCEHCNEEEAEVHIRQTTGGQTREFHLCQRCAKELAAKGIIPDFSFGGPVSNLLGALWSGPLQLKGRAEEPSGGPCCPSCGMDLGEFRKTGMLGCPNCYVAFRDALEPLLRKVQGTTVHRGMRPGDVALRGEEESVDLLRRRLAQAVAEEKYELAAELRDRIRILENRQEVDHESL